MKQKQTILTFAVTESAKKRFEKFCAGHGTDPSKMLRAFVELSTRGGFARYTHNMARVLQLVEGFDNALCELAAEMAREAGKKSRRGRQQGGGA